MNDSRLGSACSEASLDEVLESFLARVRRGERPSLEDFADSHPEYREEIRELFPALMVLEDRPAGDVPPAGRESSSDNGRLPAPVRLGEYRILREIGHGGMGVVYEAVQETLGRHVALKVLPPQALLSPGYVERFRREAQAAARLHHTNIVPVYGVGQADGVNFYAMQFIEGRGLNQVIEEVRAVRTGERPRPDVATATYAHDERTILIPGCNGDSPAAASVFNGNEINVSLHSGSTAGRQHSQTEWSALPDAQYFLRVAELGMQVAEALEHAHSQGILHRDVKPANLLLDAEGRTWVTDFGLAKLEGADDLTHSGDIVGTIRYMAPERFQGCSDPRSDVYGLGLTLYELLTLRPAFDQEDRLRLIDKILHEAPPRPRTLQRQIPRDLETIVLKAIAREPATRYATAAELAEDLRRFLADRPIQARRSGPLERLWRWCRRNPALAVSGSLTCLALLAVTAVSVVLAVRENLNATRLTKEQVRTSNALRASQRKGSQMALIQGQSLCETGDIGPGICWFSRSVDLSVQAESPELERAARMNLAFWAQHCAPLEHVLQHTPKPTITHEAVSRTVVAAEFSPDGRMLLTAGDTVVRFWRTSDGVELGAALQHSRALWRMAISPDGRRLATASYGRPHEVRLWNLQTRQPIGPPVSHRGNSSSLAFSPDSRLLLSVSADEPARLFDADTAKLVGQFGERVSSAILGPDCKSVLTAGRDVPTDESEQQLQSRLIGGPVRLWDIATGAPLSPVLSQISRVRVMAFRPDGKAILTLTGLQGFAQLWDTATWKPRQLPHNVEVVAAAFSPDCRFVVTVGGKKSNLWDADSTELRATLEHPSAVSAVIFDPDGPYVISRCADQTVILWESESGKTVSAPLRHRYHVHSLNFAPGGRHMVTGSQDGLARIWRTPAGLEGNLSLCPQGPSHEIAFSPDSMTVLTGSRDHAARLWSVQSGQVLGQPRKHDATLIHPIFSPDGAMFLTTRVGLHGKAGNVEVELWNSAGGTSPLKSLTHKGPDLATVAFSSDGRRILTASVRGPLQLWETATGKPIGKAIHPDKEIFARVLLSPDGEFILTVGINGQTLLWDSANGRPLGSVGRDAYPLARFSPDGRTILTGRGDGLVQFWETATRRQVGPVIRHPALVLAAHFSPDGNSILTTCADRTTQLWNTGTGQSRSAPLPHESAVEFAEFSPDSRLVVTGTRDRFVRLWDATTGLRVGPALPVRGIGAPKFSPDGRILGTVDYDLVRLQRLPAPISGTPQQVEHWVQTINGLRLDDDSAIHVLDAAAWRQCRDRLQALHDVQTPDERPDIRGPSRNTLAWHQRVAETCEARRQWTAAEWHLTRMLRAEPDNPDWRRRRAEVYFQLSRWTDAIDDFSRAERHQPISVQSCVYRGICLARLGRWGAAADDYSRALNKQPDNFGLLCAQATLLLLAGRIDEYRRLCASAEQRFSQKHQAPQAHLLARACLLSPQAEVDPAAALRLAQQAARADPKSGVYLHTLGLAHYRTGRHDLALQCLQKSSDTKWPDEVLKHLVLAMALYQSGRPEDARWRLHEAVQAIEAAAGRRPAGVAGGFPPLIDDWLPCYVLRREAESLILGTAAQSEMTDGTIKVEDTQ